MLAGLPTEVPELSPESLDRADSDAPHPKQPEAIHEGVRP